MKTLPALLIFSLLHLTCGQYIRTQQYADSTCEGEVFHTLFETVQCHQNEDEVSTYHKFTYDNETKVITQFACVDANCDNCTEELPYKMESICSSSLMYTYVSTIPATDGGE